MYFGEFTNEDDVYREFSIAPLNGTILFAVYSCIPWEGEAEVLYLEDGKLYHVEGAHCSCFGLEGQWRPEEVTIKVLRHRLDEGYGPLLAHRATVKIILDEVERGGILRD